MERAKPQTKKKENTSTRPMAFPKRRNAILKKAYELSVLCDVDVAFIVFSTSGRATIFSGNKRVEEVLLRYLNLPRHDKGDRHERLRKTLEHMRDHENDPPPRAMDFEREIQNVKFLLEDANTKLRMYEIDHDQISSLNDVEYHEEILQAALDRVRARQLELQGQNTLPGVQSSGQDFVQAPDLNEEPVMAPENQNHVLNCSFPPTDPQPQMFNLPLRDQAPLAASTFWAPPGQYTLPGVQPSGQDFVQTPDLNEEPVMAPENQNHVLNCSFSPTDPQLQMFKRDQAQQASSTFWAPPGRYTLPGVQPSGLDFVQTPDLNEEPVMAPENQNHVLNCSFPPTGPQIQMFNLPLRDQAPQASSTFLAPPSSLFDGNYVQFANQVNPNIGSKGGGEASHPGPSSVFYGNYGQFANQVNPNIGSEGGGVASHPGPSSLFYGNYGQFANQVNPNIGSEGGGEASHPGTGHGHINMPGWSEYHAIGKGNFQA